MTRKHQNKLLLLCCIALIFSIIHSNSVQAQGNVSVASPDPGPSLEEIIDRIEKYKFSEPLRAIEYGQEALRLAQEVSDPRIIADINIRIGQVHHEIGNYAQTLQVYSDAMNACEDQFENTIIARCLIEIGQVYRQLKIYKLALMKFEEAEKLYRSKGNIEGIGISCNNAGMVYCHMQDYDRALQYFNDVLDLPVDQLSDEIRAMTYTNFAKVFAQQGDLSLAHDFYNRASRIYERIDGAKEMASIHSKKGDLFKQCEDYEAALIEYEKAEKIFNDLKNRKRLANAYLSKADIYFYLSDHFHAIQLINEAIAIAQKHNLKGVIQQSYYQLYQVYQSKDNPNLAMDYYFQYIQVRDSIHNENLASIIAITETKNTLHQHSIKLDQLENERKFIKTTQWLVLVILALFLLTLILAISRIINQRKANKVLSKQRNILKETLIEKGNSEAKYKALFSQANDAIFLMDHETFVDCNDKTLEIFECERNDIIGQPPYKFSPRIQPDGVKSKDKALQLINACYEGSPQRFYWKHTTQAGNFFDAEVSLNMIILGGKHYIQAIVRDISERIKNEKQMVEAREKAENATESKTFFLAKMSHEIRTMLGGITSSSELMNNTSLDQNQTELLEIINISAGNLLSIVNEILDLSKIEAGKIEIEDRPFKLGRALEEVVNAHLQKAKTRGNTLFMSIHPKIPEYVQGDELRVKQILTNLVSNAIKFTDRGEITIEVNLDKELKSGYLIKFIVKDTGIGIPEHRLKDMFEEYSQSDVSTSRKYGGTGLGLNIVYKLIQLMKGSIDVNSTLNLGTEFMVILPFGFATKIEEEEERKKKLAARAKKKYNILLAEDNVINQKITIINLERMGHKVDLAVNGTEAWKKYQENDYDLILMDVQMPEMDGIEVTHLIRKFEKENPGKKPMYIIALTANILGQDAEYCLSEGMNEYIAKPFTIEELAAKLNPENGSENSY